MGSAYPSPITTCQCRYYICPNRFSLMITPVMALYLKQGILYPSNKAYIGLHSAYIVMLVKELPTETKDFN